MCFKIKIKYTLKKKRLNVIGTIISSKIHIAIKKKNKNILPNLRSNVQC